MNETTFDEFEWTLSGAAELCIQPVTQPIADEFLSQGRFSVALTRGLHLHNRTWDVLKLSVWHEAEAIEAGGVRVQYAAGWGSAEFWRLSEVGSIQGGSGVGSK
jgi:hypothetical protein